MTRFEATQAGVLFKDWVLDGTGRQLYAIGSVLPYLAKLELDPDRRQATLASLHPLPSGAAPASLWLSAEGKRLAVAMADGDVLVYDTENLEAPVAAIASAAVGGIEAMAFDDTLTYLAAGALDEKTQTGSLLLWHIRTQTLLAARSYEGFWVDAVRFSGDTLYYGKDDTLYRLSLAAPETDAARLAFFSALSGYEENEWSLLKPVPVPDADTLLTVRDGWSGLYALVTDWKEVAKE
jgi:WD40 repeat protein